MRGGCDRAAAQALHARGAVAATAARGHRAAQGQGLITYRYVRGGEMSLRCDCTGNGFWTLPSSTMVFISCNLELEAFMEHHMVFVYTGNQLQLGEDTDSLFLFVF